MMMSECDDDDGEFSKDSDKYYQILNHKDQMGHSHLHIRSVKTST